MARRKPTSGTTRKSRPALTPEARENQLIAKAYDLVEQRLDDGTATSQETTHFLKLGSAKAKLESLKETLGDTEKEEFKIKPRTQKQKVSALKELAARRLEAQQREAERRRSGTEKKGVEEER